MVRKTWSNNKSMFKSWHLRAVCIWLLLKILKTRRFTRRYIAASEHFSQPLFHCALIFADALGPMWESWGYMGFDIKWPHSNHHTFPYEKMGMIWKFAYIIIIIAYHIECKLHIAYIIIIIAYHIECKLHIAYIIIIIACHIECTLHIAYIIIIIACHIECTLHIAYIITIIAYHIECKLHIAYIIIIIAYHIECKLHIAYIIIIIACHIECKLHIAYIIVIIAYHIECKLHIALSWTQPHVSEQNILYHDLAIPGLGSQGVGTVWARRRDGGEEDLPDVAS